MSFFLFNKSEYIGGFIVFLILLGLLVFFSIFNINVNQENTQKITDVITIENMRNAIIEPNFDLPNNFCSHFKNDINKLDNEIKDFTKENCMSTKCGVWLNGEKCVAGNENGPIYKTDNDGNKIPIENYFYMDKCYGKCY
jgi:hypothetical protein